MGIVERIDKVTGIPDEYRGTILPPPISVKIELTAKCNYKCSFCGNAMQLRKKGHMDFDLYARIVDDMLASGVKELGMFYLGESFLYPHLEKAIRYAKNAGCEYVFLTSNGSIASESKVEACFIAGLDSLKWSLNYADVEQFVDIARVKAAYFDRMIANIKRAKLIRDEKGYACGLYASYIEYDGEQGERMQAMVKEIEPYVDEIYALPLYNQADLVTEDELKKGWKPTAGNRGRLEALREGLPCWAVLTEGHVSYDGLLTACCFDHNDSFVMADLKEVSFMDGWNSETFQELRKHHLAKDVTGTPCEKCVAYL